MNTFQSTMKCPEQSCDKCLTECRKPLPMWKSRWSVRLRLRWQFTTKASKWSWRQQVLVLKESVGRFDPAGWCIRWRLGLWRWSSDVEQEDCQSRRRRCCLWEWGTRWRSECTKM